jgi:hypothetical protein
MIHPILCQGPLFLTKAKLSSLRLKRGISTISSPSTAACPLIGDFLVSGVALAKLPLICEGDGDDALLLV